MLLDLPSLMVVRNTKIVRLAAILCATWAIGVIPINVNVHVNFKAAQLPIHSPAIRIFLQAFRM